MSSNEATCHCRLCAGSDDVVWGAWERRTADHIRNHGWSVVGVGADEQVPGWAYTVGLWHTLRQAELCIFALPIDVAHGLLNDIGERVRAGGALRRHAPLSGVIKGYDLAVRRVDESWFDDLFCAGLAFYQRPPLPFVQVVWPDPAGRFPWQPGAAGACRQQPTLVLPADEHPDSPWHHVRDLPPWPFPDGCPDQGVFTTLRIMAGAEIVGVVHDAYGEWQFLDGEPVGLDEAAMVQLKHVVEAHPEVCELADLRRGEQAWRQDNGTWRRVPREQPDAPVERQR